MSNVSGGASSGTSTGGERQRRRVFGVPRRCWCGYEILAKISKSEANPYRRYYRCAFAVERKLENDNHNFKWVDEATLDEIQAVASRTTILEQEIKQFTKQRESRGREDDVREMELKLEKEILERVEEALVEAKCNMKNMMFLVCLGCVIIVVCSKLLG